MLPFSAEGQLLSGHFYVNEGFLRVPHEVRYIPSLPAVYRGNSNALECLLKKWKKTQNAYSVSSVS